MEKSKRLHPTSVRLTREELEALRRVSRREKRSVGNVIRVLLGEALANRSGSKAQSEAA